jgi:hypothetical protein
MFRIVSRSRRGAKGAGYGWLLVTCGTLASIGGNVAHARPNLVAQAIAAAIPLAVLAMLEGLKGDASEISRLTQAIPEPMAAIPDLDTSQMVDTTVCRADISDRLVAGLDGHRVQALAAALAPTDGGVQERLRATYARGRPDGGPWTARTLAQAAGCGRSSAASFLRLRRENLRQADT